MIQRDRGYDRTLRVDEDTMQTLDYLRDKLNSPKAWIVRRLVAQEYQRLKKSESKEREKDKEVEVAARP